MKKQNTLIFIVAAIIIAAFILPKSGLFVISGTETMTRTASATTVNPGATFSLSYTAVGTTGAWGGTVSDTITGGCTISGKTALNFAMMSDLPNPLTYTVTAPASGSCTFTGDYKFGTFDIKSMPNTIVTVSGGNCLPTTNCEATTCTTSTCNNGCGTVQGTKVCTDCTDTCSSKGFTCGQATICGASKSCGTCATGKTCTANKCVADEDKTNWPLYIGIGVGALVLIVLMKKK